MKLFVVFVSVCVLLGCGAHCSPTNANNDYNDENKGLWSDSENLWSKLRRTASSRLNSNNANADASQLSEAQPFLRKINNRLTESNVLCSRADIQERIRNLAKDKLESCKTAEGNSLNMSCVGHLTGQMMQMIASVERTNRALPNGRSQNSEEEAW